MRLFPVFLIIIFFLQFNDFLHIYRDSSYPILDILLGKPEQKVEEVPSWFMCLCLWGVGVQIYRPKTLLIFPCKALAFV